MSIAFGLIACTSQPGVSLLGQTSPTGSPLATGRRRLTVNVEIESLVAASDARILVGGHVNGPPYGPGLHWVDLADGTVRRAFPPGGSSAIGRVFSKRAHARGHDLVVDAYPHGDPERPTLRHVLAVDPSRGSITPVVDVGPWSATTSRGDERFIASLDRVFRASDHAESRAPTLGGSWVLNETHWMDWMGPVLVSVTPQVIVSPRGGRAQASGSPISRSIILHAGETRSWGAPTISWWPGRRMPRLGVGTACS